MDQQFERRRSVQKKLFQYQSFKRSVEEFENKSYNITAKMSETGIHGTYKSDPTARGGIARACPPKRIQEKIDWCEAIESCMCEIEGLDFVIGQEEHGLKFIADKYFCLTGDSRKKEMNTAAKVSICKECDISSATFYDKLNKISDIMIYHAARKGLL